MDMSKLIYWQKLELRDKICKIHVTDISEHDNYRMQGYMLGVLGFSQFEAHYPDDTWVGNLRLKGWQDAK